jgi:zinc transporter ZupT
MSEYDVAVESFVAGIAAAVACGLGVLPVAFGQRNLRHRIGLGYAFAGGLMFAASVYNLLIPAFTLGGDKATELWPVVQTLTGLLAGCATLWFVRNWLTPERLATSPFKSLGTRQSALVFLAMTLHSFPEGVAVGVGYGAEGRVGAEGLGLHLAVAIAIHNIPEGMAVAIPLRAAGASLGTCFWYAFFTSLPQPIAAVPAALMVWFFAPLMLPMLGFAAGAMMYLVVVELIPDALEERRPVEIAWAFMVGFSLMVLVQVVL